MSEGRGRRAARTGARLIGGGAVAAGVVVAVVAGLTAPWPTIQREPAEIAAVPAPAPVVLACGGGLLSLGRDPVAADGLSIAAAASVTAGARAEVAVPDPVALDAPFLTEGDGGAAFTALPEGRTRADIAAASSAQIAEPDLAGYAASACRPPLLESWLVGGSAATGAADLVVLSNPGDVAATVELAVFGAEGLTVPPGGAGVVVPPRSQGVVPLAGLAIGEERPVVRVQATGAPVQASLQSSITRTLTAGGVDQVGALAQPATDAAILGVTVTGGTVDAAQVPTLVRVLSPSADATVRVTVTPAGSPTPALTPTEVDLLAGEPLEVDLGGLENGTYTVEVASDQPVVSAVWQATGFEAGDDFAWYTPAPLVDVPSVFATPAGPEPVLTLQNPGDQDATVVLAAADGGSRVEVIVLAGESTTLRLAPQTVYTLDAASVPIRAAVSLAGDGALAGYPVWPADAAAPPIIVYP